MDAIVWIIRNVFIPVASPRGTVGMSKSALAMPLAVKKITTVE